MNFAAVVFSEGQNLAVIPDGFEADYEHVAELAAALVKAAPDAIIAGPAVALRAVQDLTHTIPLIGMSEDMVAEEVLASLARPGGNTTGISLLSPELDGKRQDILIEAVPGARRIGAMADANAAPPYHFAGTGARSTLTRRRAFDFSRQRTGRNHNFNRRRQGVQRRGVELSGDAVVCGPRQSEQSYCLGSRRSRTSSGNFAVSGRCRGGCACRLWTTHYRFVPSAGQVLRGAKPTDIPVQQPDRFELVINLKAAKTIGVEVPATLVARADKLIDERT